MLKLWKTSSAPQSREDLFVARYERMLAWALQLTGQDRQRAEDLLHTAFIEFTLGGTDLNEIANLDGYLRAVLRLLHLSEVRKATRLAAQSLSIAEYDSVAAGLRTLDPRVRVRAQDELRAVCQYACLRKETSKAGSVFILRFFHGYYPSEIVRLLRSSPRAVSEWLRIARGEARIFLDDPRRLSFMRERVAAPPLRIDFGRAAGDVERALRRAIFASSQSGGCPSPQQWDAAYRNKNEATIDCDMLAHLVACAPCLDRVNALLGLPLLAERHPADRLGGNSGPKAGPPDKDDGDDQGQPGSGAGASAGDTLSSFRRRAREVFEHRPEKLCISANGLFLAAQTINAGHSEQTLSVSLSEEIGFIEVLSEQDVRLLLLHIEPPPEGLAEQSKHVEFSDGRTLQATLRFDGAQPTLRVVYHDPALAGAEEPVSGKVGTEEKEALRFTLPFSEVPSLWRRLFDPGRWLRPGAITAMVAALLTAAVLFFRPAPPVSAAKLLSESQAAEEASAARMDSALRRTINFEERRLPSGELVARRRIEVWRSGGQGRRASRVYDEKNALVAGEWAKADGSRLVYRQGDKLQPSPADRLEAMLDPQNIWQLELSSKGFAALTRGAEGATVEEGLSAYALNYRNQRLGAGGWNLVKASLTLSRADLHAVELTLLARQGDEVREYWFTEISFERRPTRAVAPAVFEPDPELLKNDRATGPGGAGAMIPASPSLSAPPPPTTATAELEVEALRLLSEARADLGEQVSVTRTPEGILQIRALVETDRRKAELLKALEPVKDHRAVKIEVNTVAEAARRQSLQTSLPQGSPVIVQQTSPVANAIPASADLRRYFSSGRLSEAQIEAGISRFANRTLDRSLRAAQRAWALKRLAERFSPEELRALDREARTKWLGMIEAHALALRQEAATLSQELEPIFSPAGAVDDSPETIEIKSDEDLARAAGSLYELCAGADKVINAAFTISPDNSRAAAIKAAPFWRSLRQVERLAAKISGQ